MQIRLDTWKPRSLRVSGSGVQRKIADTLIDMQTAIIEGGWECRVRTEATKIMLAVYLHYTSAAFALVHVAQLLCSKNANCFRNAHVTINTEPMNVWK